ncbi:cephalotocin receptor 1, partial [Biomphalaria glabrata]
FYGDQFLCVSVKYFQLVAMYASSYVLLATAVDRYYAICHPFLSQTWTARHAHLLVAIAWAASLVFSLPQVVIFSFTQREDNVYDCWANFDPDWTLKAYVTWTTASIFILPTCILGVLYGKITWVVWKAGKMETTLIASKSNGAKPPTKSQALKPRKLFGFTIISGVREAKKYEKVKLVTSYSGSIRSDKRSQNDDWDQASLKLDIPEVGTSRSNSAESKSPKSECTDIRWPVVESKQRSPSQLPAQSGASLGVRLDSQASGVNNTSSQDGVEGSDNTLPRGCAEHDSNVTGLVVEHVAGGEESLRRAPQDANDRDVSASPLQPASSRRKPVLGRNEEACKNVGTDLVDILIRSEISPQGAWPRSSCQTREGVASIVGTERGHDDVNAAIYHKISGETSPEGCQKISSLTDVTSDLIPTCGKDSCHERSFLSVDSSKNSTLHSPTPSSAFYIYTYSKSSQNNRVNSDSLSRDTRGKKETEASLRDSSVSTNKKRIRLSSIRSLSPNVLETRHSACSSSSDTPTRRYPSSKKHAINGNSIIRTDASSVPQGLRMGISRAKVKTIKLTFTVVICYVLCWAPFFVGQMWAAYDFTAPFEGKAFTIILLLASVNSCTNPWIYSIFSDTISERVKNVCKKPCHWLFCLCRVNS